MCSLLSRWWRLCSLVELWLVSLLKSLVVASGSSCGLSSDGLPRQRQMLLNGWSSSEKSLAES
ncbi:unnamed protein product, partial [Ilex paraguariensis]